MVAFNLGITKRGTLRPQRRQAAIQFDSHALIVRSQE